MALTGQQLLDRMEDVSREFDLQVGEVDHIRGLRALNTAQDHFETLAATSKRSRADSPARNTFLPSKCFVPFT